MIRALWGVARNDLAVWLRSPAAIAAALLPALGMGVLVAMLANVASHRYGFEFWGIRTSDTRQSMASIVYWSVTGSKFSVVWSGTNRAMPPGRQCAKAVSVTWRRSASVVM